MKLMIDLDGTMYHGTKIIESAYEFMKEAQRRNIDVLFLTNNATRTPIQAAEHMLKMGYENIQPEQFYTSAMASADEVKRLSDKRRAYMIGELGLKEALIQNGFELVDHDADFVFATVQTFCKQENLERFPKNFITWDICKQMEK